MTGLIKIYLILSHQQEKLALLNKIESKQRLAYLILNHTIREAGDFSCQSNNFDNQEQYLPIYLDNNFQHSIDSDALSIGKCILHKQKNYFQRINLFTKENGRKNRKGEKIVSLYQKIGESPSIELIEGISKLDIYYLILKDGSIIYLKKEELSDWRIVRGIKIVLYFQEPSNKKELILYIKLRNSNRWLNDISEQNNLPSKEL